MITARLAPSLQHAEPDQGMTRPSAGSRRRWWIPFAAGAGLVFLSATGAAAEAPKPSPPAHAGNREGDTKSNPAVAQDIKPTKLHAPNQKRGLPLMEALSLRASTWDWADKPMLLQDLSDLLWAANGINRPGTKKRTAPSAVNAQDVDIYVFLKDGAYLYDAAQHALNPVAAGDHRAAIDEERPGSEPAALLILVSDLSRFKIGNQEDKQEWAAIDSGIVSQNISLFCAATGLGTRPRTDMNKNLIKTLLKLKTTQLPVLNQAVGHPKGESPRTPGGAPQGSAPQP